MKRIRTLCVFGTRPEAIKMVPVLQALNQSEMFANTVCATAQHRELLDSVLQSFSIRPDYDLNIMEPDQELSSLTVRLLQALDPVLKEVSPDLLLVNGDTTSAFASALAAFYQQIPVAHVEAGLRTGSLHRPYPEEANRRLLAQIACLHFAPTQGNADNLRRENVPGRVYITGNTGMDVLRFSLEQNAPYQNAALRTLETQNRKIILLTCHRRENRGRPMEDVLSAAADIAVCHPEITIVLPLHRSPAVQQAVRGCPTSLPNFLLLDPLPVSDMHRLLRQCYLVMTDSGGLQEEAAALGKPTLVLREETERPECLLAGTACLCGTDSEKIFRTAQQLLNDPVCYKRMAVATRVFGDGQSGERIVRILSDYFAEKRGEPEC
jgi:UDP-N-acetylglucosamine 2-epimerase (non-hydrolysing)